MDRLTFEGNFCDIAQCESVPGGSYCENGACSQRKVWERLKAYEDSGMTPGETLSMRMDMAIIRAMFQDADVERMKELASADKEGRVVVLPCKVGEPVWRITQTFETYPDKSQQYVMDGTFFLSDTPRFGKTVFLTREEAEKALERMAYSGTD